MTDPARPALRIEYRPLASLRRLPRNPKRHDLAALHQAFERFGYASPVLLAEVGPPAGPRELYLVAGHGRLEALEQAKGQGKEPPRGIQVAPEDWLVPCVLGLTFETMTEAEAYALADNRLTVRGGYDEHALADLLADLVKREGPALRGTGHDEDELHRLLKKLGRQERDTRADEAPEPPPEPVARRGDLWRLGDHRLVCGDSALEADVALACAGERAALMATDPPYGIAYDGKDLHMNPTRRWDKDGLDGDDQTGESIQPFLEAIFKRAVATALAPHAAWYLWHAQLTQGFFAAAAAAADLLIHRQIVWVKPKLLFGRGDYHWRHELCFYGWVRGKRPPFYGDRNQTTIWELDHEASNRERVHPTQKPVALFEIPIRNHTKAGELIYEPFSGSGSALIAAERTGRRCAAIEIEPRYVDVAVQRWETLTGRKAVRQEP